MENLVDKATNNLAQKCNSNPMCSDNNLEIQVSDNSASDMKGDNNSNTENKIVVEEVVEVASSLNSYYEPISCSSKTNFDVNGEMKSHQTMNSINEASFATNQNSEEQEESLTISITSNQQNAINNLCDLSKNCQYSNTGQLSDNSLTASEKSTINIPASLLNLSVYKSDSEETDNEANISEREIVNQDMITKLNKRLPVNENLVSNNMNTSGSLCNYVIFSESSSEDSSSDSESINKPECEKSDVIIDSACYRKTKESSSDSETSSSEDSENEEEDEVEETVVNATNTNTAHKKSELPRVKGELTLDDLPPVPDLSTLKIDVKEEDCIQMGTIASIVDKLVMVQSLPETPAYDVDTLLFLEKGKRPLGHVYDVIGPVSSPMYAIRFNSRQEIDTKGITKELAVYSAPKTEHTQYVFLKELLRIKGSDASWQGDNEVPPEFVDFSDDEEEFSVTNCTNDEYEMYRNKRKRNSLERHQIFETEMNQRNKLDSAYHKLKDSCEPKYKKNTNSNAHANRTFNPFAGNTTYTQPTTNFVRPSQPPVSFGILPQPQWSFVPTIPPPSSGFGMQPLFQNHFCQPFPAFANQVLAFPPMNVPPPCSVPPPVPPSLPPMNIPPPIAQSVASAPPTVMPLNPLPPTGNIPFPHPGVMKNGHNLQQTDRTSNTQHRRHGGARNHSSSMGKPQSPASMSQQQQQQTNVPLPKTQTYGHQKSAPPVPHRPPMQSLPPSLRNGPSLPMVTNYGMQPVYRPFANCMQPPAPIPPGNMGFRPNGNATSIPKTQGTGQVCPMPYPPCLGLPKFTTPPPNVSSGANRPVQPAGPHFSGGVATFGHVPPPPCTQNGRARQNFGSQNGCGFYRKQF